MAFHAKALEIYTTAYQHIQNVDEEADLEVSRLIQQCSSFRRIVFKDLRKRFDLMIILRTIIFV